MTTTPTSSSRKSPQISRPPPKENQKLKELQEGLSKAIAQANAYLNGNLTDLTFKGYEAPPPQFLEDLKKVKTLNKITYIHNWQNRYPVANKIRNFILSLINSNTNITEIKLPDDHFLKGHEIPFRLQRNELMKQCQDKQSGTITFGDEYSDSSAEMIRLLEHKGWDNIIDKMRCQLHFNLRAVEGKLLEDRRIAKFLSSGKVQFSANTYLCGSKFDKSPSEIDMRLFDGVHSISNQGYHFADIRRTDKIPHDITDGDLKLITYLLKNNRNIHTLSLTNIDMTDDTLYAIEKAIQTNTKLISIDLSDNKFTVTAAKVLLNTIRKNPFIADVRMEKARIKGRDLKGIVGILRNNCSIVRLDITPRKPESNMITDGQDDYYSVKHAYSKFDSTYIDHYISKNQRYRDEAIIAIREGNISELKHLLRSGVSPNAHDDEGKSLLHHAVMTSQFEIFTFLIEQGANAHWWDKWENQCIAYSNDDDKGKRFKEIVDNHQPKRQKTKKRKHEVDPISDLEDGTPKRVKLSNTDQAPIVVSVKAMKFLTACQNGDLDFVKKTLAYQNSPEKKRKLVNVQTLDGKTAAHLAAQRGYPELLKYLIENGADLSIADSNGKLIIHEAATSKKPDQIATLISSILNHDASAIDAKDRLGLTPLYLLAGGFEAHPAKTDKERAAGAYALLAKGARPNIMVEDFHLKRKMNALHKAIYNGFYYFMKAIIQSGNCDINQRDDRDWSALHYAVTTERPESVDILRRLLIEPDINLRLTNLSGKTPFALLKERSVTPVVKEMGKCIDERESRHQLGDSQSGIVWTKSLKVIFGSRNGNKDRQIDLSSIHEALKIRFKRIEGSRGNDAVAHLTFVVSDKKHAQGGQDRRIKIDLKLVSSDDKIHVSTMWQTLDSILPREDSSSYKKVKWRSPDALRRILRRYAKAPEDAKKDCVDDSTIACKRPFSTKGIKMAYHSTNDKGVFERSFHHSEQALFDHLEQESTLEKMITKLRKLPEFKGGAKVYAVILSIHSKFYVCKNCEISALGEHKLLSKNLGKTLKKFGYILPKKGLKVLTTVTTDVPYKSRRQMEEDHREFAIDLRSVKNNGLILSQDASVIKPRDTKFQSRKPRRS